MLRPFWAVYSLMLFSTGANAQKLDGEKETPYSGQEEVNSEQEEETDSDTCFPSCREGFVCYKGTCISACNPPCPRGQKCVAGIRCVPEQPTSPSSPPPASRSYRRVVDKESTYYIDKKRREEKRLHLNAVLTNPSSIILTPIFFEIGVIPLEVQAGWRYAAIDLQGAIFITGDGIVGGSAEGGIRLLPMGKGLDGFYIVPRAGISATDDNRFIASVEFGYGWIFGHVVLNAGGGLSYTGGDVEYPFLPLANLSIGFGD